MSTDFASPTHIADAIHFLEQNVEATILGGGTDLMIKIKDGRHKPLKVLNICRIQELKGISFTDRCCEIGSAVTLTEVLADPRIGKHFPCLFEACVQVGSRQVRNRATIGGNLCNASPAADAVLALMAFGAELVLVSASGASRTISCEKFFTGPGKTVLRPGEILTKIRLPIDEPVLSKFLKIRRTAVDIAIVATAFALRLDTSSQVSANTRIALGAVAATPVSAERAVRVLVGHRLTHDLIEQAAEAAASEASPISDHRASKSYRLQMVPVLVKTALLEFMNQVRTACDR